MIAQSTSAIKILCSSIFLALVGLGCSNTEGPSSLSNYTPDRRAEEFPVRNRSTEVQLLGPSELKKLEAEATHQLLARQSNDAEREGLNIGLNPEVNGYIISMPDSIDAELVSLIYSIRIVGEEKGYWERPRIRYWWPIPELKRLTPGGYDEEVDLRMQTTEESWRSRRFNSPGVQER